MKTEDFDYDLPESFIAQEPAVPRDSCKLMVVHNDGSLEHRIFHDIGEYLQPGDLLVVNETRVLPARLLGRKKHTGAHVEVLLLDQVDAAGANRSVGSNAEESGHIAASDADAYVEAAGTNESRRIESAEAAGINGVGDTKTAATQTWNCLVKPGKRLKVGAQVEFEHNGNVVLEGEVVGIDESNGSRSVRFNACNGMSVDEAIHLVGHTPLPPYIKGYSGDEELYQTVYSRDERSAAAPTAGLHFTQELLDELKAAGVEVASVHLEVGLDTFRLVSEDDPLDHKMHTELYSVPQETVDAIIRTKGRGGRVIAVGTTSVRSLESAAALAETMGLGGSTDVKAGAQSDASRVGQKLLDNAASDESLASKDSPGDDRVQPLHACTREATSLYILPGYEFKVVDAIITNFHVPRSTLMMLVSAFSGRENIMNAYEAAKQNGYRFFSFGDAMLLL